MDLDGVRVGLHDFVLTFILRKDAVAREALQRREGGLERGRLFIFIFGNDAENIRYTHTGKCVAMMSLI
ncbi:hypothetical protein [Novosphingobium sp. MD-1]|uniref:hypothetical protein n=1 Tax=Novosphingobium sp. MD-1 TaxID=1630648 RepID=UPI0011C40F18|nr:hypothetical protein [Novosphingobium sp. MD-1]